MKLSSAELAYLLRGIAARVESGDSFEGSIEYLMADEGHEVTAAFRVGNLEGQGGMVIIEPSKDLDGDV